MRKRRARGFTLVELVIVIAIVGILAAIAIPRFIDIRSEAYNAARDSIIGSVRAGILTTASRNQVGGTASTPFPPDLEQTWVGSGATGGTIPGTFPASCDATDRCFELIIPGGFESPEWTQESATSYKFTHPIASAQTRTCTYGGSATGTFVCTP